ncbi:MAG: hypothetical protein QME42_11525 [bacterium]|nr:hypothetical protein [bacterium]
MEIVKSKNGVFIRLTVERWLHIVETHDDLAGYYDDVLGGVEDPDYIIKGYQEAIIALKEIKRKKFLAIVYKELSIKDGFIITAYFTSKLKLEQEVILWKKE